MSGHTPGPQLFGIPEMKEFAENHSDPRVKAMFRRLNESMSKNARWCQHAEETSSINAELLAACERALTQDSVSPDASECYEQVWAAIKKAKNQ